MSYTQHAATATCQITNVLDTNDLISQVHDYLTNHEDEAPTELLNCDNFDEFADILDAYVSLVDGTLTVNMDTEETNSDGEVFDFLTDHYAHLMSSEFMKVVWVSYDSRSGLSADCTYYDNQGNMIDVEKLLKSQLK
jgi:hypothetical protein